MFTSEADRSVFAAAKAVDEKPAELCSSDDLMFLEARRQLQAGREFSACWNATRHSGRPLLIVRR
jgi:hypothetical protein